MELPDLSIDELRLEEEWRDHPNLYIKWAEVSVDAQEEFDQAKAHIEEIKSSLGFEIRQDPTDFGLAKVTDKGIETAIPLQPSYKRALERLNKARREVALSKAALDGLEHRKRALSMLVELWIRDYYSDSTASREKLTDNMKSEVRRDRRRRALERKESD